MITLAGEERQAGAWGRNCRSGGKAGRTAESNKTGVLVPPYTGVMSGAPSARP